MESKRNLLHFVSCHDLLSYGAVSVMKGTPWKNVTVKSDEPDTIFWEIMQIIVHPTAQRKMIMNTACLSLRTSGIY